MSDDVNPGIGGQKLIRFQLAKIAKLRWTIGDRFIPIEIDGGVSPATGFTGAAAVADVQVAGSAVFQCGSVANPAPYGADIRPIRAAASHDLSADLWSRWQAGRD